MKQYFLTGILALASALAVQAQQFEPIKKTALLVEEKPQPLVLVNNQETMLSAIILNDNDVKSLNVLKGNEAVERFGQKAADGAILMNLKQDLPLVRLEEVYKTFKIPAQQQKLTLAINGKHVKDPTLLLADLRQIERVEVTDFDVTSPSRWSFEEQYLNIITKPQP
ncbi:hypothetical protein [Pontibacter chinhatensis]|uniref:TonB-dependent Receptor Plug Domain n=1 Tax=Pontibacter chinhatensis TaxID=1436961 RepID=A0A1I2S1N6_9BACT|nr:hypothetical protein [Pontibacter chinhatensis]SFG45679.1 hypothetical protein SAMN05421739_102584 [Pontibacter chinhatensis]